MKFTYHTYTAKYEKEKANNAALQEQLDRVGEQGGQGDKHETVNSIPKPQGTAGKDYSIQIEMGLSGSKKKHEKYCAIQVSCISSSHTVQSHILICSVTCVISH
jgi:hypothetical protein